jgi:hypothetical protein
MAQGTLITHGVSGVTKVVTYDQGSFWPAAYARHTDGSVTAIGNPWLGGGHRTLTSGVNDMARLDAITPGNTEAVAMVGSAGLTVVRWDRVARGFTTTTVDDGPLAQNARLVRATPFAQNHMIAFVTADGSGVRCYRDTGVFLAAPAVPGPVLDLETLRNASGVGRLLVRNAAGITCIDLAGAPLWSVTGSDGVFARWPLSSTTVRAAWIHHVPEDPDWQLTLLGDNGQIGSRIDLYGALGTGEDVKAAFAVDANHDGTIDLVVKTSMAYRVILNSNDFQAFAEVHPELGVLPAVTPVCVPDLLTTHAGLRFRLVDECTMDGISWSRVDLPFPAAEGEEGISLRVNSGVGGLVNPQITNDTDITFDVQLTADALLPFVADNSWTQVQVVAWQQDASNDEGRLDDVSKSNVMFHLLTPTIAGSAWRVHSLLEPELVGVNGTVQGWNNDKLYWLTIRLCNTPVDVLTPNMVSEPITLVTSLSFSQSWPAPGWDYIHSFCDPNAALPHLAWNPDPLGGGVVGVIQRCNEPPPPPPSGIPTPADASSGGGVSLAPPL